MGVLYSTFVVLHPDGLGIHSLIAIAKSCKDNEWAVWSAWLCKRLFNHFDFD